MRRPLLFIAIFIMLFSCKKDNSQPQWDIEVLGPIAQATFGIEQLIGDSSVETNGDGTQVLRYDTTFRIFNVDSVFQINDTTIPTIVLFPPFPSTISPGQAFTSSNNVIDLDLKDVKLSKAKIASGNIQLEIKNTLMSKVNFTYTIPGAIKDGQPFSVYASVDSGSISDPRFLTATYDLSGYDINMTGLNGNDFNSIVYTVVARADSFGVPFSIGANDTVVDLNSTLLDIVPEFGYGYLGQNNFDDNNSLGTGIDNLFHSGLIKLDSVRMQMDLTNYIGAEASANVSYFNSVNTRTNTSVSLTASSFINNTLNFNRASRNTALPDPVIPSVYTVLLDHTNSNIVSLMENLPDRLDYGLTMNINPLGNISGYNDFIYKDKLIDIRMQIITPLKFALNQLFLVDTLSFNIGESTDFDPVGPMNMTLIADNTYPFDLNVRLYTVDSLETITDSLFVPDLIAAAPYDADYRSTGSTRTIIKVPVDAERKQHLVDARKMVVRFIFNTPDYPQLIQMYTDYEVKLKLVADGTYSIR